MRTAHDILAAARSCDFTAAAEAFRAINNAGDGLDPDGGDYHFGALIGEQDGIAVYDDAGDAVIVGDVHGAWAVRVSARILVELDSAVGPRVRARGDVDAADIDAEIPSGWSVDYSSGVRTDSGGWSYPLVAAQ